MSNKTQLSNNNTKLASLIETLQGKASGGGSVETCTVTLNGPNSYGRPYNFAATVLDDDGKVVTYYVDGNSTLNVTIANVLCNSILYVQPFDGDNYNNCTADNATLLYNTIGMGFVLAITAPAGGEAVITNIIGSGSGN